MIRDNQLRERVPAHTIGGIDRYIERRIEPGSFLRAVLENNLREALGRADETNRDALFDIVAYIYNCCPFNSWGSPEAVETWLNGEAR
jgi:hypothetical protein